MSMFSVPKTCRQTEDCIGTVGKGGMDHGGFTTYISRNEYYIYIYTHINIGIYTHTNTHTFKERCRA